MREGSVIQKDVPQNIRCVVFDFDGTLVMSNAIKRDGFFAVAKDFPNGELSMEGILANPPGDRYAIMNAFGKKYEADPVDLVEAYARWCEEKILMCPERIGAGKTLTALREKGLSIWINSATPQAPLREVVGKRYPAGTFDGVLGGHGMKVENLQKVMQTENLPPDQVLMVGDGFDDRDGAAAIGCHFIGLTEGTLAASNNPGEMISDLTEILRWLAIQQA